MTYIKQNFIKMKLPRLTNDTGAGRFIGLLLNSAVQTHVYHLQTRSYASHMALRDYYDAIPDIADNIAEMYQGAYNQLIKGYSSCTIVEDNQPVAYLTGILAQVQAMRYTVFRREDTQIQNEIDTVVSLINSTLYKLNFLG